MDLEAIAGYVNSATSYEEAAGWLEAARVKLPHGEWLPWVRSHIDLSERQVQRILSRNPKTTPRRFPVARTEVTSAPPVEPKNFSPPTDPWARASAHITAARELIQGFLASVRNRGKRSRLTVADGRLEEVADLCGYSPEMLYTAAELVAQASEFPDEGVDYR